MTSNVFFAVHDGTLLISTDPSTIPRIMKPDGLSVVDLRDGPDDQSALVLLEPPLDGGRVRNLIRVDSAGQVIWRGELPEKSGPTDSFISLGIDPDGTVSAATWSGYRVRLDPSTGQRLGEDFTK